jgi:hypothetical protein
LKNILSKSKKIRDIRNCYKIKIFLRFFQNEILSNLIIKKKQYRIVSSCFSKKFLDLGLGYIKKAVEKLRFQGAYSQNPTASFLGPCKYALRDDEKLQWPYF